MHALRFQISEIQAQLRKLAKIVVWGICLWKYTAASAHTSLERANDCVCSEIS